MFFLLGRLLLLLPNRCRVVAGRSSPPRATSSKWLSMYPALVFVFTLIAIVSLTVFDIKSAPIC